jgi:uncharacterized protein (TIGR02001 family)
MQMKHSATTVVNTRNTTFTSAMLLVLSLVSGSALAEPKVSGNLSLTSDYLFRGISQTDEGMALQGALTLTGDSGFYLSAWGSNINFGQGSMEIDLLAGWTGALNDDWTTDVGVMQYRYPNGDNATDQFNYVEFYSKFTYQGLTLGLVYSNDYFGTDVDNYYYLSGDYNYNLTDALSLQLHAGFNKFEDNTQYTTFLAAGPVTGDSYLDWSVGVTTTVLGSSLALKYADTDIDSSAECYLCDGRLVLSLTKAF